MSDKTKEKKNNFNEPDIITIRTTKGVKKDFQKYAKKAENRSMSAQGEFLIKQFIEEKKQLVKE